MIRVKKFVVNPLQENTYIISDETNACIFIDPGYYYEEEHDEIREYISENNLKPAKITNTHCHFDHIMGVEFVRNEFKIPFHAHAADEFWVEKAIDQGQMFGFEMQPVRPIDNYLEEGTKIEFGSSELEIIHVPGHSPGHVVFYNRENNFLIAGDVLFYGSIGRSDLPGGNHQQLISNIKSKLFVLPEETKVYCGHGPETTLGFEKINNPYLT